MSHHRRLGFYACAYVCVAVVLATGCAAPPELSFDSALSTTQAALPPPDDPAAPAADVVARPAQPGDSAQPSDPAENGPVFHAAPPLSRRGPEAPPPWGSRGAAHIGEVAPSAGMQRGAREAGAKAQRRTELARKVSLFRTRRLTCTSA
jgi:hypothetical protein